MDVGFGERHAVDLLPGGADVPVTGSNAAHYSELYAQHLLVHSIDKQFAAFRRGFLRLCNGAALKLFRWAGITVAYSSFCMLSLFSSFDPSLCHRFLSCCQSSVVKVIYLEASCGTVAAVFPTCDQDDMLERIFLVTCLQALIADMSHTTRQCSQFCKPCLLL